MQQFPSVSFTFSFPLIAYLYGCEYNDILTKLIIFMILPEGRKGIMGILKLRAQTWPSLEMAQCLKS
jgi:hypothetical protein